MIHLNHYARALSRDHDDFIQSFRLLPYTVNRYVGGAGEEGLQRDDCDLVSLF